MDNTVINLDQAPYYVTVDKGNYTAYVLSGSVDDVGIPDLNGTNVTPITYTPGSGFLAGKTAGLNGTTFAIAADPVGHLIYVGTYFGIDGMLQKYYGVQIYDPSKNFQQCGFIPLPVPPGFDQYGLKVVEIAIYNNQLFVGADNISPESGASGIIYIIDNFAGSPTIHMVNDIEPAGEGMRNFSFFETGLYLLNYNSHNLVRIDIGKKAVSSVTSVSDGGRFCLSSTISKSRRRIYITQCHFGADCYIKIMDVSSDPPLPVGYIPVKDTSLWTLDIDDDINMLVSASGRDNVLTLVDTSEDKVSGTTAIDGAVYDLAIDGHNHRTYVANATKKQISCYARRIIS